LPQKKQRLGYVGRVFFFKTGNSKSKDKSTASTKAVRKSLTGNLSGTTAVNQMAVTRDYNKPLTEDQPYLVQVTYFLKVGVEWVE
jgi:hypothetical protein